jgi:hypothetical protein
MALRLAISLIALNRSCLNRTFLEYKIRGNKVERVIARAKLFLGTIHKMDFNVFSQGSR